MGFRSTFCTQQYPGIWPEWFKEKHAKYVNFGYAEQFGCLSSKLEAKYYDTWADLPSDIQKAIDWERVNDNFIMVYLHECGGITRYQIEKEKILISEPCDWKKEDQVKHWYCYGCSDVAPNPDKIIEVALDMSIMEHLNKLEIKTAPDKKKEDDGNT